MIQVEEHLVGVEGFMVGINAPGQIPSRQRLAVEGDLSAVLIGILASGGLNNQSAYTTGRYPGYSITNLAPFLQTSYDPYRQEWHPPTDICL
jgi:hypothetical protein